MEHLTRLWSESSGSLVAASTAVATVAFIAFCRWSLYPAHSKVIHSPLKTVLPGLSPTQLSALHYGPDAFPGARDVLTPYGSIRIYEFGPTSGRKVAMVHGISTSCQTLAHLANDLASRGCRVLLFDLFGRGFSDGVGDLPHDARLYVSQLLAALASSPLPWSGDGAFDLLGYSMGGGIAVHFAAAFPRMVRSLVLLAPAGLIRAESFGRSTRFVFQSGIVPERLLAAITKRRLRRPISSAAKKRGGKTNGALVEPSVVQPVELAAAEVDDPESGVTSPLNERVMEYVKWMLAHHRGFVPAFMGCVRNAPLVEQHETWRRLSDRPKGTVCVILGRDDSIIHPEEIEADALPLIGGKEAVSWSVVAGGHDFPMTMAGATLKKMYEFWGMEQGQCNEEEMDGVFPQC